MYVCMQAYEPVVSVQWCVCGLCVGEMHSVVVLHVYICMHVGARRMHDRWYRSYTYMV